MIQLNEAQIQILKKVKNHIDQLLAKWQPSSDPNQASVNQSSARIFPSQTPPTDSTPFPGNNDTSPNILDTHQNIPWRWNEIDERNEAEKEGGYTLILPVTPTEVVVPRISSPSSALVNVLEPHYDMNSLYQILHSSHTQICEPWMMEEKRQILLVKDKAKQVSFELELVVSFSPIPIGIKTGKVMVDVDCDVYPSSSVIEHVGVDFHVKSFKDDVVAIKPPVKPPDKNLHVLQLLSLYSPKTRLIAGMKLIGGICKARPMFVQPTLDVVAVVEAVRKSFGLYLGCGICSKKCPSEDDLKAIVKPLNVDYIPRVVQGNVGQVLEQKNERDTKEMLCEDQQLNQVIGRNVGDLSSVDLQRFAMALVAVQNADIYMFNGSSSYLVVKQRLKDAQVIRSLLRPTSYVIVVQDDLSVLDYLSDFICCLYENPGVYGVVTLPFYVREGINFFLARFVPTENLKFGEESLTFKVAETPQESTELWLAEGEFTNSQIIVMLGENGAEKNFNHLVTSFLGNSLHVVNQITMIHLSAMTLREAQDVKHKNSKTKNSECKPKAKILDTCTKDAFVRGHTSIVYKNIKHEIERVLNEDILKIDMGCHIVRFIVVEAHVLQDDPVVGRISDVIAVTHITEEVALRLVISGLKNKDVFEAIQKVAEAYDCKMVASVIRYQLKQFVIDGNKVVLCVFNPGTRVADANF